MKYIERTLVLLAVWQCRNSRRRNRRNRVCLVHQNQRQWRAAPLTTQTIDEFKAACENITTHRRKFFPTVI